MLRVGIIGCGKIADSHASQIARIPNCRIVGVADRELLMAQQLHARFEIDGSYDDVASLLKESRPDVVHITTPPQSHFPLARQCLEAGAHVYLEKPFTVTAAEASELIAIAKASERLITVGHDDQFSHVARRMRALVADGYLGGQPVHIESHYCYELSGNYARALLGDSNHWVRRLPGGLLQNVISHGLARIAEYLTTDEPLVIAHGFISPELKAMGEGNIIDELRVIVDGRTGPSAYFTFSSQMRPSLHQLRLYGKRNGLLLDEDQQTLIKLDGKRLKSYAEKFVPPVRFAGQYLRGSGTNLRLFLQRDFHMKSGMKYLIEAFYGAIRGERALPISYEEILRNAQLMDAIVAQLPRDAATS